MGWNEWENLGCLGKASWKERHPRAEGTAQDSKGHKLLTQVNKGGKVIPERQKNTD